MLKKLISLMDNKYNTDNKQRRRKHTRKYSKMVKTRHQMKLEQTSSKSHENGVRTRSSTRTSGLPLERVELPKIVLSKEMNNRLHIRKAIAKKSKEKKMEKLEKTVKSLKISYKKSQKQNNEEMLSVWKNISSALALIDFTIV